MDALITVAELTTHLQRPVEPAAGALAVAGASGAVRSRCGWNISRETATFELDGSGTTVLNLPTLFLSAVISVDVAGELVSPAVSGDLHVGYRSTVRGQLYRYGGWPSFSRITVTCEHGYDPVPDVVRLVALTLASRTLSNPERLKTAAVGSISRTFDLSELDVRLLDPYRLP